MKIEYSCFHFKQPNHSLKRDGIVITNTISRIPTEGRELQRQKNLAAQRAFTQLPSTSPSVFE